MALFGIGGRAAAGSFGAVVAHHLDARSLKLMSAGKFGRARSARFHA